MGKRNSISSLQLCEAAAQNSELELINFVKFNKSHILTAHTHIHTRTNTNGNHLSCQISQPAAAKPQVVAGVKLLALRGSRRRAEGSRKRGEAWQEDLAKKAINIHSVSRVYHFLFAQPTSAPKYAVEFAARSSR